MQEKSLCKDSISSRSKERRLSLRKSCLWCSRTLSASWNPWTSIDPQLTPFTSESGKAVNQIMPTTWTGLTKLWLANTRNDQLKRIISYEYEASKDHKIFSRMNLSEVYMHLSAAIFMDSRAIYSAERLVWAIKARAAHSANWPPDPTPITSSISRTFPVPSS